MRYSRMTKEEQNNLLDIISKADRKQLDFLIRFIELPEESQYRVIEAMKQIDAEGQK